MMHMFGNYGYLDSGWGIFMRIFMMLIPLAFLLLFVLLIFELAKPKEEKRGKDEIQIAKERYAKGEITKEEYEEIVKTLKR